jgi:hypothetical protein
VADESKFGQKPGSSLKCEDWEALLTDALDGLLPAGQAAAFHGHSETCANCGDLLAHAKQGQEWLGYLHEEPEIPVGLIGKILEKTVGASGVPLPVVAGAGVAAGGGAMTMPWRRNFHETRLLMTVAMAFFSIALTLNLMGVKPGSFKLADLKPSEIGNTLSRQFYGARSSVVRYYDHLRFVYELESRTRELRRDVETQPQQQNNQQQNQQKPGGKNGSAQREGTGSELRASVGQPTVERIADSGQRIEQQGTGRRAPGSELGSELRASVGQPSVERIADSGQRIEQQGTGHRAPGSELGSELRASVGQTTVERIADSGQRIEQQGTGRRAPGSELGSEFRASVGQPSVQRIADSGQRIEQQGTGRRAPGSELGTQQGTAIGDQRSGTLEEAAEVRVSVGTGKWISLGHSGTGLQQAGETAGYVEGSLV